MGVPPDDEKVVGHICSKYIEKFEKWVALSHQLEICVLIAQLVGRQLVWVGSYGIEYLLVVVLSKAFSEV